MRLRLLSSFSNHVRSLETSPLPDGIICVAGKVAVCQFLSLEFVNEGVGGKDPSCDGRPLIMLEGGTM